MALNKKASKKTIAWEHVTYETGGILFKDTLRKYYKNLKGIVCINSPAIEHYKQYNKTYFIPNIIGEPFENQEKINFKDKENFISFVGRLDREKNVIALLEIFKKANVSNDWKLQIIGDGNERVNLEQFVEKNQLQDRVIFYGTKTSDEILELLRKSKIFGFTSLKEALPTVLVEAMFCGNAIVSYNCDYGPSDIINEKNGFLINLNNQQAFKTALEKLINDKSLMNKMAQNSISYSQEWKKEEVLKKWNTII